MVVVPSRFAGLESGSAPKRDSDSDSAVAAMEGMRIKCDRSIGLSDDRIIQRNVRN